MKETFEVIDQMKRDGVIDEYAVAGAVGALFYVEPFNTEDVDILINLNPADGPLVSLEPIFSYLRENGHENLANEGVEIAGWPVQFIPVSDSLTSESLLKAEYLQYDDELRVRVVRPEYLAAEAIKLGRPKDIQRVVSLLEIDEFDRGLFHEIIEKHGLAERWNRMQNIIDAGSDGPKIRF
ncbi:MAG TPA: hypothetical protein VK673_16655 [Chthoniobacterales bacterium]|nr:hypothetical protein [Chthoniobacterales bacterium]